ncbi:MULTISPECIES: DUF3040 domain-containing protein [unclassified Pseudactinotalea]|uniref:DUF3040 domain-containing protein n=1 Tax=unclassified Pseudactinotalea TaxID=2649176 RepID=UPI0018838E06|nr:MULTISPECIES: DUF3040 domain-containing protein [unclassified Pseudactinotalea]
MPLSEYEQRVLEQLEQQLRSDDPRLVEVISRQGPRRPLTVAIGVLIVLLGLGGLIGGVASGHIWLGSLGFVAMFGGVLLAMRRSGPPSDPRGHSGRGGSPRGNKPHGGKAPTSKRPLLDRLDDRWEKRRRDR